VANEFIKRLWMTEYDSPNANKFDLYIPREGPLETSTQGDTCLVRSCVQVIRKIDLFIVVFRQQAHLSGDGNSEYSRFVKRRDIATL
jgi:hypothetical protein